MIRSIFCCLLAALLGQCSAYPEPNYLAWALLLRRSSSNPVKSVTAFSAAVNALPTTVAVPETSMSRAFVVCSYRVGAATTNRVPTCQLSSSTTISINAGVADATTIAAGFLVEFASGARVQRGSTAMNATVLALNVPIEAVDTSRSFIIAGARTTATGSTIDEERTVAAQFSGSSQITFTRTQGANPVEIEWQTVELPDSSVQSGQIVIPSGLTQISRPISPVDQTKTFVIFTSAADAASNGNDSELSARCGVPDASSVLCGRLDTLNNLTVNYFVVSMTDGTTVLRGHEDTNLRGPPPDNTDVAMPVTITAGFDRSRSMALVCSSVDPGDLDTGMDSAAFTAELASDQTISIQRGSSENRRAVATWNIVQFAR